jgi:hypothetical protein
MVRELTKLTVAFGLPDSLRTVNVGDRIGLQVMHVQAWQPWDQRAEMAFARRTVEPFPQISNPIEFVVTEQLLAQARAQWDASR